MSLEISVEMIRDLRQKTGAGVMDCKKALEQADGNSDKAEDVLREQGLSSAAKKSGRETREGLVHAYIHTGGRVGALVQLDCETDFVARTPEFQELAHNLAMQIAAMPSTSYISKDDIEEEEKRPIEEISLLDQSYIKDPSRTVNDIVQDAIARVGENVKVRRFSRFALGE
ncbi:MAG: translation elongation factor Ts [Dehalococcoidia bacterium]|nr:translation elongation factor Ts [Dehalococcoidia bacterium]